MELDKTILICGLGSIGKRHLRNLISLGFKKFVFYRQRKHPLEMDLVNIQFESTTNLKEAISKSDIAFICNPTSLHVKTAIECAKGKLDVYMEKPIASNLAQLNQLKQAIDENNISFMMGYMLRFHPAYIELKSILNSKELGALVSYYSKWGEYLPNWHPWEDYRESYAAKKELGGGVVLTLSHEIDLLFYLFDEVKLHTSEISSQGLDTDCETKADLRGSVENSSFQIELNYLDDPSERITKVDFEKGTVVIDPIRNSLKIIKNSKEELHSYSIERNDLFLDAVSCFFNSKRNDFKQGRQVLELCLNALGEQ